MVVRVKEILIRYEDDGELSPLSKEDHQAKYAPLRMEVHHHCAPPKLKRGTEDETDTNLDVGDAETIKIDMDEVESVPVE